MKRSKLAGLFSGTFIAATLILGALPSEGATKNAPAKKKINLQKDMSGLGDDQAVVERAKALDPNNQVQVVQNRAVDRNSRFEIGADYGIIGGGSNYLNSQAFGGNLDFHINPRWSVGVRYNSYINNLTDEGKSIIGNGRVTSASAPTGASNIPWVDSPVDTTMGVIDWYPVYGKLNFFDTWVPHFDLYTLAGFGRTNTVIRGGSNTYTAGGGVGLWISNNIALRLEARYQTFEDSPTPPGLPLAIRRVDTVIGQASLGILL